MTAYYEENNIGSAAWVNLVRPADLKIGQRHSMFWVVSFAEEQVPQTQFFGFDLEFFNNWNDRLPTPFRVSRQLKLRNLHSWENFILDNWLEIQRLE